MQLPSRSFRTSGLTATIDFNITELSNPKMMNKCSTLYFAIGRDLILNHLSRLKGRFTCGGDIADGLLPAFTCLGLGGRQFGIMSEG